MTSTLETVVPAVPELFIEERAGHYLLLNPRGPRWCLGSKLAAVFLELCDGSRTVGEIHSILGPCFQDLTAPQLLEIADKLSEIRFFEDGEKTAYPPVAAVFFNVIKTCNLSCPFCYYDSSPQAKHEHGELLSTAEWLRVAESVARLNPSSVVSVSGGEPLLRKDLVDIIEGIARLRLDVRLITNGTLFTRDKVDRLAKIRRFVVQVSIDSLDPAENAKTRGAGSLEKALDAVEMLLSSGVKVTLSSTVTQINKESIHRFQEYCDSRGIGLRKSGFFLAGDRSKEHSMDLALSNDDLWTALHPPEAEHAINKVAVSAVQGMYGSPKYGCGVGHGFLAINHDGSVSPCNHLPGAEMAIGNVRATPLEELWASGFERFGFVDVDQMPLDGCASCHVRYVCGGGCKANSFHAYGTMRRPPPNCDLLKQINVDALWADLLGPNFVRKSIFKQRHHLPILNS